MLYCKTDYMTFFEYNSSRMIIIFAFVLSLMHDFRILNFMNNYHDILLSTLTMKNKYRWRWKR
jgi:hypothetical protein